jgi:drug/metabolite transporter (DMT)-like permease
MIGAHGELLGVLACLGASVCYGVSYIYIDRFVPTEEYSLPSLATIQLASAAVVSLPLAVFLDHRISDVHLSSIAPLLILGIVGTGIAYLVNYELIRSTGPIAASVVSYLIPIVAVLLSFIVLSETISLWSILGGAITLVGIALTRTRRPAARAPKRILR